MANRKNVLHTISTELKTIVDKLELLKEGLNAELDDEVAKYDEMTEKQQEGQKGTDSCTLQADLESCQDFMNEAIDALNETIELLPD